MTPTFNWVGEGSQQDAMRVAPLGAAIVSLYDGRNDDPKVFLVVTRELLAAWAKEVEKAEAV